MLTKIYLWKNRIKAKIISRLVTKYTLAIYKRVAIEGIGSDACLKEGFLPVPVHYYSPIPDIFDLSKRKIWDKKSNLTGVNFNEKTQIAFLHELGKKYAKECDWPLKPTKNPADYFVDNQGFSYGCAAALHSMIRHYKPKRVIEIGSGNSSQVIAAALSINKMKDHQKSKYIIVDPYPTHYLAKRPGRSGYYSQLLKQKVELLDPKFFDQLDKNDILFIDSGHTVRIGGDVNFLFLEVLPRLKPGVVVHIHDIALPYEYPKVYATNEVFRQFWTEQYLLQSFLIFNPTFEVLLAMNYIQTDHKKDFEKAFPLYDLKIHIFSSGSFWIRRKVKE